MGEAPLTAALGEVNATAARELPFVLSDRGCQRHRTSIWDSKYDRGAEVDVPDTLEWIARRTDHQRLAADRQPLCGDRQQERPGASAGGGAIILGRFERI